MHKHNEIEQEQSWNHSLCKSMWNLRMWFHFDKCLKIRMAHTYICWFVWLEYIIVICHYACYFLLLYFLGCILYSAPYWCHGFFNCFAADLCQGSVWSCWLQRVKQDCVGPYAFWNAMSKSVQCTKCLLLISAYIIDHLFILFFIKSGYCQILFF